MAIDKELLITEIGNVTSEGVAIFLNKPAKLKSGNIHSRSFWVSWDKIGSALLDNYCNEPDVEERQKIRNK